MLAMRCWCAHSASRCYARPATRRWRWSTLPSTWRLAEALKTLLVPHQLRDHLEAVALVPQGARLSFENVHFRYPGGRQVFQGLNLDIQPGQRVGLVGRSGGGKSTLLTLLQRFHDVDDGRILIDRPGYLADHPEQPAASHRHGSAGHRAVQPEVCWKTSACGRPDATDEEVWQAAVDPAAISSSKPCRRA